MVRVERVGVALLVLDDLFSPLAGIEKGLVIAVQSSFGRQFGVLNGLIVVTNDVRPEQLANSVLLSVKLVGVVALAELVDLDVLVLLLFFATGAPVLAILDDS